MYQKGGQKLKSKWKFELNVWSIAYKGFDCPVGQWFSNGVRVPLGVLGGTAGVRERYHYIIIIRYPYHFTVF